MERPLVSVIMPVYNGENYIRIALESILKQTYQNLELLLIDDCGADRSMDIVHEYAQRDERIRIFYNGQNRGIAYSRNVGLDNAKGAYIAIMDDDDYAFDYRLEKQVRFLENNPTYDVVGGKVQLIDAGGEIIKHETEVLKDCNYIETMFLFFNIFHNSEVMFRRELMERAELRYEDQLLGMEDFKFWVKASKYGKMTNLEDLLLQHRMTGSNETTRVKKEQLDMRREVFARIQRYSLEQSGFILTEQQFRLLRKVMQEDGSGSAESREEFYLLYETLRGMILQARERNMNITEAMEYWFRDIFAAKVSLISRENMWD